MEVDMKEWKPWKPSRKLIQEVDKAIRLIEAQAEKERKLK
jgi:hypothetical protein